MKKSAPHQGIARPFPKQVRFNLYGLEHFHKLQEAISDMAAAEKAGKDITKHARRVARLSKEVRKGII